MIALAGCGQQAAALAAYSEMCHRLDDQLGIRPGRELASTHLRVLRNLVPGRSCPVMIALWSDSNAFSASVRCPRLRASSARTASCDSIQRLVSESMIKSQEC